jgi:hypothetical protein
MTPTKMGEKSPQYAVIIHQKNGAKRQHRVRLLKSALKYAEHLDTNIIGRPAATVVKVEIIRLT